MTAIGRAVRGEDGRAEAAVSVSLPTSRFSQRRLPELVGALAVTARDIEAELRRAAGPGDRRT